MDARKIDELCFVLMDAHMATLGATPKFSTRPEWYLESDVFFRNFAASP